MLRLIQSRRTLVLNPSIAAQIVAVGLILAAIPLRAAMAEGVGLVLPESITVFERSTAETFDIKLAAEPSETVTVSVTSSRTEYFTVSPPSLTFTNTNWNIAQQISVRAFQENDGFDDIETLTFAGTGVVTGTVIAFVRDNGITVRPLTVCEWWSVSPRTDSCVREGETETYDVALLSVPSGTVTVSVASEDTGAVTVSPGSLTFTPQNWSMAQQVSLTGVQDDDTGDESVMLRFSGGMSKTITVEVEDDDQWQRTSGGADVLAFDVPKDHALRTGTISAAHPSMERPAYRTFQTDPVEVNFVPRLASGESATVCLPGDGELAHYGSDGWTVLPTKHRMIDGMQFACSVVTSTSPFAVVHPRNAPVPTPSTVTLKLSSARIAEAGGAATVTATLDHASSEQTTVTVSAWATRPSLLAPLTGRVLTIAAGQSESTGTVKIAAHGDSLDATDTVVTVSGTSDTGFPVASATLTIVDDDGDPTPVPVLPAPRINEVAAVPGTTDSLRVSWAPGEPDDGGSAVRYSVRYRDLGAAMAGYDSVPFHDGAQDVAGTQATISGLSADTVYEVQVRAESAAGVGLWAAALGRTDASAVANTPPSVSFVDGGTQRAVAGTTFIMRTRYADAQTEAGDLSFSWTQTGGPAVELIGAEFPSAGFRVPAGAVGEALSFRVTVTDEGGLTAAAEATVTVAAPDLRADDFAAAFAPETLNPGAHAYSATALMSGFDLPVPVSVTASPADASFAYYVGEDEDDAATEIAPGDELYLSVTAGETPGDTVTVKVVVGTGADAVSAAWTVTTAGAPVSPATPPTAVAGTALTGKRGGEVTLSGSGTKHAGGSQAALSYSWRIKDASHAELLAGTSWLKNATSATATYSVPRRKDVTDRKALDNGQWTDFELTVTDGDGEMDTDTVRMTIQGSTWKVVSLSVADASAQESSGEIAFAVSLSTASRDEVTVAYATSDGTALAGSDYTSASGTLTFQPGDTSKTVTVSLLDDVHDEGTERFTLTLSNPTPAKTTKIADATATGSITNADPLQRDWLARFGRAAASDAIAAVTARLQTPRGAGSHLTLGGHHLSFDDSGAGPGLPPTPPRGPGGAGWLSWSQDPHAGAERSMSGRELLMGTSFRAVLGNGTGSQWTGWGQGASVSRFSSGTPGLSLSGETATGSMGMDYERGRLLTGFAMTHSLGEGTAHGAGRSYVMGSSVTTVLPYARLGLTDRLSAWGLAGTGSGRLTLDLDGGAPERYGTDLSMTLAAMGVRGELLTPAEAGGFSLALKADAFWVRTESERVSAPGVGNLAGAQADASRLRAVLDGSRTFALTGGASLTPSVELGVRHDGGDAETGTGMELGAGVGYADPSRGLDMALRVHGLAAHAEGGYSDWSVSGSLRFVPGGAGRGLSMSLTPSYGADPGGANPGGAQRLWMQPDAHALAANDNAEPSSRLDAEVGYGMAMFGGGFTGTPNIGFGLSETSREVRMGWRLAPAGTGYGGFEFSLDAARREAANEDTPEHRIGFGITSRW